MTGSNMGHSEASPAVPSFAADFERWRRACSAVMGARSPCSSAIPPSSSLRPALTRRYPVFSTTDAAVTEQQPQSLADALGEHKETAQEKTERERTEQWTDQLVRTSPMIRFMTKHLAMVSCSPLAEPAPGAPPPILIAPCPPDIAGGFSPSPPGEPHSRSGILICSNRIFSKTHLEDTLAHEMVHWWDHCRFKVDWSDLKHHACSEIRAAALSGDCNWTREIKRRNFGFTKQHQACARRRAILSVEANPSCKSHEDAVKAVDEVFNSCWADTRPFDEIY